MYFYANCVPEPIVAPASCPLNVNAIVHNQKPKPPMSLPILPSTLMILVSQTTQFNLCEVCVTTTHKMFMMIT